MGAGGALWDLCAGCLSVLTLYYLPHCTSLPAQSCGSSNRLFQAFTSDILFTWKALPWIFAWITPSFVQKSPCQRA